MLPKDLTSALTTLLLMGSVAWTAPVVRAQDANPPLAGFDVDGSDEKAMRIADRVMTKLGGRRAWDDVRFLSWNFFGRRSHVWDKQTGNLRLENGETLVLMNIHTKQGKAWESGSPLQGEALTEALDRAHGAWINDSYWVFMPYKLKDSGVTLTYHGQSKTSEGADADVLQLTFRDVGRTPDNRYLVYVDKATDLVVQWDYFKDASDTEPGFQIPWKQWERHGPLMLSADRGERKHDYVAVLQDVPESVFSSPEPIDPLRYRMK